MVDGQQFMILSESTKSAQLGQRACPCWVTCLPHLGTLLAPDGQKRRQTYGHENEMYNVGVELKDVECL